MHDFDPSKDLSARIARAEAAAWMARLQADDRSEADKRDFRLWLAADSRHAAAFEAVDQTWNIAGGLPRNRMHDSIMKPAALPPRHVGRRAVLAGLGLAVVSAGTFSLWRPASAKIYETDVGEQKHVALDDGSQVFLDTNTRVAVHYDDELRSVALQFGRANFRVEPDSRRPFVVEAAERKIIAHGSNFDVRCDNGRVQVVLIHGHAAVRSTKAPVATAMLETGDRLVVEDDSATRDKPDLRSLLAWQTGQAIFEDTPLFDAVQEMNRYSTDKLRVMDARVAAMRVSGAYRVGDNRAFANAVAELLSIGVRENDDQLQLIAETN